MTGVEYVLILCDKESENQFSINTSNSLDSMVDDLTRLMLKKSKAIRNVNIQCTLNNIKDIPLREPSLVDRNENDKIISPSKPAFSANTFGSEQSISELSASHVTIKEKSTQKQTLDLNINFVNSLNKVNENDLNENKKNKNNAVKSNRKQDRTVRQKENKPV